MADQGAARRSGQWGITPSEGSRRDAIPSERCPAAPGCYGCLSATALVQDQSVSGQPYCIAHAPLSIRRLRVPARCRQCHPNRVRHSMRLELWVCALATQCTRAGLPAARIQRSGVERAPKARLQDYLIKGLQPRLQKTFGPKHWGFWA